MTIEERQRNVRRWPSVACAIALVIVGWFAVIVALTFGSAPGKSMAIIGPPSQALAAISRANGRILASNDYFTIARSDDRNFVTRLYAAGALLVLDAEQAGGCTGRSPSWRATQSTRSNPGMGRLVQKSLDAG
jgi:hypothetical protein